MEFEVRSAAMYTVATMPQCCSCNCSARSKRFLPDNPKAPHELIKPCWCVSLLHCFMAAHISAEMKVTCMQYAGRLSIVQSTGGAAEDLGRRFRKALTRRSGHAREGSCAKRAPYGSRARDSASSSACLARRASPSAFAAFGPQIDEPIGFRHHVEIVFDHDRPNSRGDEPMQDTNALLDIRHVQSDRRLIENIEGRLVNAEYGVIRN